ncbi:deoxynucleoside triphosphate triphosphohydrolase SAMHD1 homolog isoform X2 [Salvia hispanica]|uniref:deoxynucleoside triphosphate triphosphohydrolase SAMHD1 homolog isoform X2 n=1 Tax=Salvia hispanica TaxID=49212 RepID=UPI002009C525|nr:deoxynucleoside triphosphate triphosphohydrolase SAMHD1 homolog isoform X2 [Salvia hispanica]
MILFFFFLCCQEMIIASEKDEVKGSKEKKFLYDIVANGRNGIDVDKFDYIVRDSRACGLGCNFEYQRVLETMRVIDDEICYRAKEYLHRTVYMHAKVKAVELMLVDAMTKANDVLQISSYINEPAQYWKLDDTIVKTIETSTSQDLKESRDLILRIRRRDLYQYCNEYSVPKENLEHFKSVTPQDIVCSQNSADATLNEEDIAVSNVRIDLTRGNNNPLNRISFFEDYDSTRKISICDGAVSHLLPASYEDMIVRVYTKKPDLVEAVSKAFENFQVKTYGVKTQVHETPTKTMKKRLRYHH